MVKEPKAAAQKILNSLKDVEELMVLMRKHKIDFVELDGVKLQKTRHYDDMVAPTKTQEEEDEATLFWSAP